MKYKIEFWNEDGSGNKKDLSDAITGNVLYPYSVGLTQVIYFNSKQYNQSTEINEVEENSDGETYSAFIKAEKYINLSFILSDYQVDILHFLNFHSHIYLTDSNNNKQRIARVKTTTEDSEEGFKSVTIGFLSDDSRTSIGGNY